MDSEIASADGDGMAQLGRDDVPGLGALLAASSRAAHSSLS